MSTLKTINIIHPSGSTNNIVNDASGNVGIGTSSPSEKLSVHSAIGVRGSNFASTTYVGSSVNTTGVYTGLDSAGGFATNVRDAGYLTYSTNNTERMRIDSSGNVGVGTSSPQKKLVVSNAGAVGMEWSPTDYTNNMRQLVYNRTTSAYAALRTEASQHELYIGGIEAARIDSSSHFYFNSGYGSSAVAYGCRAWANWDSTGAIRASGGTTSITKNGTGNWTMNFNFTMVDANYSCQATCQRNSVAIGIAAIYGSASHNTLTTTAAQIMTREDSNTAIDPVATCVAIFR